MEALVASTETEFRHALHNRAVSIEWRSAVTFASPAMYVADQSRSADQVIASSSTRSDRSVNTGDLVMQAGRPLLAVPVGTVALNCERVMIAWKDTREARRAVLDGLPLLKLAKTVFVVEIANADDTADADLRTRDVVAWLARHGIAADAIVAKTTGTDHDRLHELAAELKTGLIVAGAYGHSRVREWIIGGVTRALLDETASCSLLSH